MHSGNEIGEELELSVENQSQLNRPLFIVNIFL